MSRSSLPLPNADDGARLYQGDSGLSYHEEKRGLEKSALEWVFRLRADKFARWVADTDVVFELGVGSGWNLARLRCARRMGSDAAPHLAERVRNLGIEFLNGTREVPDASVDVVICHHTLEHLLEPAAALRELARILKPRGRLILHVPWEVERRHARFRLEDPDHHLFHWNAQNLGNLVTLLGWKIETLRVRRYGYDRFAANLATRGRLGESGFRFVRGLLILMRPLREVELIATR